MSSPLAATTGFLHAERQQWFLWVPVLFALGAAGFLSLPSEPSAIAVVSVTTIAIAATWVARRTPLAPVLMALLLISIGVGLGMARSHLVATPLIEKRTASVSVTGWIEQLVHDRRGQRAVILVTGVDDWPDARTPDRVRLRIFGRDVALAVGDAVTLRTRLEPNPAPVYPGGFDFARRNWFMGIGGTGQVFAPPQPATIGGKPLSIALRAYVSAWREAIAARLARHLENREAGFAIAVTSGQRGTLGAQVTDALRAAGLAHLLAISGLHMALVATLLYGLIRAFLAAMPRLALDYPIKKWAAVAALAAGSIYLVLSGASVSTQRAFIMVAIMFGAILVDRPAISIRNVAIAALAILIMRPESALDVSFQMSFLTVTVLVSFYEWLRDYRSANASPEGRQGTGPWWMRKAVFYAGGVVLTTVLATLATAPIAASQFNQIATYGVLGNLIAVPLMSMIVMPCAILTVMAMPLGLEAMPAAWLLAPSVALLLDWASWVSSLSGARLATGAVPWPSPFLLILGLLWLSLWRGRVRLFGLAIFAVGLAVAPFKDTPIVIADDRAKVFALRNDANELVLSTARAGRYAAGRWLLRDGDGASQRAAAARPGLACDADACVGETAGSASVAFVTSPRALWDECRTADIIVSGTAIGTGCTGPDIVIDRWDLYREGAHAIYLLDDGYEVRTVRSERGERAWVPVLPQRSGEEARDGRD